MNKRAGSSGERRAGKWPRMERKGHLRSESGGRMKEKRLQIKAVEGAAVMRKMGC